MRMKEADSATAPADLHVVRPTPWHAPRLYVLPVTQGTLALDNPNDCQPGEAVDTAKGGAGAETLVCPSAADVAASAAAGSILVGGS